MKTIAVMNHKGGVGKSTLSINIAGYFAHQKGLVTVVDTDPQNSTKNWLHLRAETLPKINNLNLNTELLMNSKGELISKEEDAESFKANLIQLPYATTHVVIDSGANLSGWKLDSILERANKVVIPLQPSFFDIIATYEFIQLLKLKPKFDFNKVCVIAMRVNPRTQAWNNLINFTDANKIELLTYISDTQKYGYFAITGTCLFDFDKTKYSKDYEQWAPLCEWLNH